MPHSTSNQPGPRCEVGATTAAGRLHPRQQSLTSPHPDSAHYVKQCHALLDRQLQVFAEERKLWNMERRGLHDRISQLETTLRRYKSAPSTRIASPPRKHEVNRNGSSRSSRGANGSGHSSASSTGDEVWRGSNPDVPPSRTFSESATNSQPKANERLPSIAENDKSQVSPRHSIKLMHGNIHKPSIFGSQIDKNLDGINFKASGVAPEIFRSVMSSESSSPLQSPSPSRLSPGTMRRPPSGLPGFHDLKNKDQYTMDAGHTPLASHKYPMLYGGSASGPSSITETPKGPEQEVPPLEPPTTAIKPPSERQESYFPIVESTNSGEGHPDPELKGPLGLTNERTADNQFLSELNTKLLQAAETETQSPPFQSIGGSNEEKEEDRPAEIGHDSEPEQEPKLRIKRSMNFGSQFGASNCGKGI